MPITLIYQHIIQLLYAPRRMTVEVADLDKPYTPKHEKPVNRSIYGQKHLISAIDGAVRAGTATGERSAGTRWADDRRVNDPSGAVPR